MTIEDYLTWLHSLVEYNKKMYANTHGPESDEYYYSAMAYKKAYDVFLEDVMNDNH